MSYRAPVGDILFSLRHVAGASEAFDAARLGELDDAALAAVVTEAGRFASDAIAPLNRIGDREGAKLENGRVFMPTGFGDVYRRWAEAGWGGVTAPAEVGGMGLPLIVDAACGEMWAGASMAFSLCPLLSEGAIRALTAVGSKELQATYLHKLVSGQWTGTMNLTEPQAGSDLAAIRTRAERVEDGTFRLKGQKIFITFGDHDMAENIIHLVLARVPGAPEGTRGLSLFLAPKFLVDAEGRPGKRNDLRCVGLEHKLGIHASPTCVMAYGENEGAVAWLVGEENKGLAAMFIMMNSARLAVGLQGVGVAERALQMALAYARERKQGRAGNGAGSAPIIEHPDVQRMLLTMKALTHAARGICHLTAMALDRAKLLTGAEAAEAADDAALLTPLAKAFSTDVGDEVASLGVQVHGGMGFIEETGAAQLMRDSRIAAIYEGTNGIQAIDLVTRKLPLARGAAVERQIAKLRDIAGRVRQAGAPFGGAGERLDEAIDALERASQYLAQALKADSGAALAGASEYLRLFSLTLGGGCLAKAGLAGLAAGDSSRAALARFYAEKLLIAAPGLGLAVSAGGAALEPYRAVLAEAS